MKEVEKDDVKILASKAELFGYSKKIVGVSPIDQEDIERAKFDDEAITDVVLTRAVEEYLEYEMGFKRHNIKEFGIMKVTRSRKDDMLYIHMKDEASASQIFRRAANVDNKDIKITPYIPPQYFERYNTLQLYCKKTER